MTPLLKTLRSLTLKERKSNMSPVINMVREQPPRKMLVRMAIYAVRF
jgi:hypothetical protein